MGEVTVGADTYEIFGTAVAADTYFNGRVGSAAWTAAASDDRSRALVTASRRIELTLEALGVTAPDTPDARIEQAAYEQALALLSGGVTVDADPLQGRLLALRADTVQLRFSPRRATSVAQLAGLTQFAAELLLSYVRSAAGSATANVSELTGVCSPGSAFFRDADDEVR